MDKKAWWSILNGVVASVIVSVIVSFIVGGGLALLLEIVVGVVWYLVLAQRGGKVSFVYFMLGYFAVAIIVLILFVLVVGVVLAGIAAAI